MDIYIQLNGTNNYMQVSGTPLIDRVRYNRKYEKLIKANNGLISYNDIYICRSIMFYNDTLYSSIGYPSYYFINQLKPSKNNAKRIIASIYHIDPTGTMPLLNNYYAINKVYQQTIKFRLVSYKPRKIPIVFKPLINIFEKLLKNHSKSFYVRVFYEFCITNELLSLILKPQSNKDLKDLSGLNEIIDNDHQQQQQQQQQRQRPGQGQAVLMDKQIPIENDFMINTQQQQVLDTQSIFSQYKSNETVMMKLKKKITFNLEQLIHKHTSVQKFFYLYELYLINDTSNDLVWGSKYNVNLFHAKIRYFLLMKRHEQMTLHLLLQNFHLHEIPWLQISINKCHQYTQVIDIFAKFLYFIFNELLIQLIRSTFYITDSEIYKNRALYYNKLIWSHIIYNQSNHIFQAISMIQFQQILSDPLRILGISHLRYLPKKNSVRPLINMSKPFIYKNQQGKKIKYFPSLNKSLELIFYILRDYIRQYPQLIGSAINGSFDLYQKYFHYINHIRAKWI